MDVFFCDFEHKNHAWPPLLAENNSVHHGSKADLLKCLEPFAPSPPSPPEIDVKLFDGTALEWSIRVQPLLSRHSRVMQTESFCPICSLQASSHCPVDGCGVGLIQDWQLKGTYESAVVLEVI